MQLFEVLQSVNAVGAIVLIMIGSGWLKQYLKHYAG